MFDGFGGGLSPGEGCVAGNQNPGDGDGVKALLAEPANDDRAGIANVAGGDFLGGEGIGERDRTVEVVGMRGPKAGDRRQAWAQDVANSECVWTMPPICGNSR